jgi:lipopolysaccharide export system ATP-binding protein
MLNTTTAVVTLEARNLAKSYSKRAIVKDVNIRIEAGQVVGLLGPNGAGKTTCFYMIVGLVQADRGQILINQEDISREPMHGRARKGIGYLPQEASVFRKLTVTQNILAILQTQKQLSKSQRLEKLESLLLEFNIVHIRDSLGMSLSGGERRRVEIARALASEPQFILLDEPFAGVDPISVKDIKHIIQQLSDKGIGVLITDHNVRETLDICDLAYIVSEGYILAQGTSDEILANQQVKEVYLGEDFTL